MAKAKKTVSLVAARRIALAAQGFDQPRPRGRVDVRHLRRVLRQLGLVQLDFVNVLMPAHYLVPFSRLGPYERERFHRLIYRQGEFIEQWAHEASIVPVESWPLLRHRRQQHRVRPWGFEQFLKRYADYADRALDEVRERGPLTADDLPEPDHGPQPISHPQIWHLKVKRQVLEAHFGFGRLAVAERRPNFARAYDLAERLIPAPLFRRRLEPAAEQRQLLLLAAHAHGIGTASDLADYYRMPIGQARPLLAKLAASGELEKVRIEGWPSAAYLHPAARRPRRVRAASLLSPFDPLVWCRPRIERLFDFDYRIEIYVPAGKRRWGYYVLPFLLGERLAARIDLKADRKAGRLLVPAAWIEPHADPEAVCAALAGELATLAGWLGLAEIRIGRRGDLAKQLAAAVG